MSVIKWTYKEKVICVFNTLLTRTDIRRSVDKIMLSFMAFQLAEAYAKLKNISEIELILGQKRVFKCTLGTSKDGRFSKTDSILF